MSRAIVGVLLLVVVGSLAAADGAAGKTAEVRTAIFAGGCYWCSEADFEKLPGVIAVESGYTAGRTTNPTYEQVSAGGTGHAEAVRVTYDARRISYVQLLDRQEPPVLRCRFAVSQRHLLAERS